jgi:hypothetical protein
LEGVVKEEEEAVPAAGFVEEPPSLNREKIFGRGDSVTEGVDADADTDADGGVVGGACGC